MSIRYYNLPNIFQFLPIVETINNGRVHSFVSQIDNDMNLTSANWNHLVTTSAIKSYIDTRINSLVSENYLFEDYFIVNNSILDSSSGTKISDNITNLLYPDTSTSAKFNTTQAIKFDSEDIQLTIPQNTVKTVANFKYKTNTPIIDLLSNESFDYPITWNHLMNYSDISSSGLNLQANESVTYKLSTDSSVPIALSYNTTGTINYSISNNTVTITNSNTANIVNNIVAKESNLLLNQPCVETLNSYYNSLYGEFSCYWDMYVLGYKREEYSNVNSKGPTHLEKIADSGTSYVFKMNPLTTAITEDEINYGSNNVSITFNVKVSSENNVLNTTFKPHLISFGGNKFNINTDTGNTSKFKLLFNNLDINYLITYDEYHVIKFQYQQNEVSIFVDGIIIYNNNLPVQLSTSKIIFGSYGEDIGFYGDLRVGTEVNNIITSLLIVATQNVENSWQWNKKVLQKENRYDSLEFNGDYLVNGSIITPVFDPDNSKWSFDIDLNINESLAPSYYDIVSFGTSCFQGLYLRYNKSQNAIEIRVNSKESCFSSNNTKGFPLPRSNSTLNCVYKLTDSGKCHIKVEYTRYSYNVYAGDIETRKIGELSSPIEIEPSYFRINACNGININKKCSYILLEDIMWWSFNTLNYTEDFQYCNLEISNNSTVVENELRPVANQIVRYPYSNSDGAVAQFAFIPISYNSNNSTIISSLLYSSEGFLIYQSSNNSISVKSSNSATPILLGSYTMNKKYHIRITNNSTTYTIQLLNETYAFVNSITIPNIKSDYMTGFMLGSTQETSSACGVKFLLNECHSDNFAWNFVKPKSFIIRAGSKAYLPEVKNVSSPTYSFTEKIISFDTECSNVNNNIVLKNNGSLVKPSTSVPVKVQIINNRSRSSNIMYVDVATNEYILNNEHSYGVIIGGLYEDYENDGFNHYIYPRHLDHLRKNYGGIKFNFIYQGMKYNFTYSDIVFYNSFNYKIGDCISEEVTKNVPSGDKIISPIINKSDYIRIIANGRLISVNKFNNINMTKISGIINGDFETNDWKYSTQGAEHRYIYFDNIDNKDYAIVVGSLLKSSDKIYATSNFFDEYYIDSSTATNNIIASKNNVPSKVKNRLVNSSANSRVYSIELYQNYIKSGDFAILADWDFVCEDYSIMNEGYLTINNSNYTFSQKIFEVEFEEISRKYFNHGEELLLSFTISNYSSGKVIVDYGSGSKTYTSNGTHNIAFKSLSSELIIKFYSDVANNTLTLSNISLVSLNKVANSTFTSRSYWNCSNTSLFTSKGIEFTEINQYIEQTLCLLSNKEYTGYIKIDDNDSQNVIQVLFNDEEIARYNTTGVHKFNIKTERDGNKIKIVKLVGNQKSVISFVKIVENPYNKDRYLNGFINSWVYEQRGIYIEDNKLFMEGSERKQVSSCNIVPNTKYNLSFNLNISQGKLYVYVGSPNYEKKYLREYTSLNNGYNTLEFLSPNFSECRLWFITGDSSNVTIDSVELEILNYIIDFNQITYNWQTNTLSINIKDKQIKFNGGSSNNKIYQYNPQLVNGEEYSIKITANISSGGLKLFYGNTEIAVITSGTHEYSGIMDSSKTINIVTSSNNTSATIQSFSLNKKMSNLPLSSESSILNTNRNLSVSEINVPSLSGFEHYDGKKIGLKIGNVYATGYLNINGLKIENVVRSKEFAKQNLGSTDVLIVASNTIEVLEQNYIFINASGDVKVSSNVYYGKYYNEIPNSAEVWYNMIEKTYYDYNTNTHLFLIGEGYTNENTVIFTSNIQKERKLLSYTQPHINSNSIRKDEKGLYDISTLFFNGTSKVIFDTSRANGKYILYRKNKSINNPYNLDVNSLYVDYTNVNKSALWNSELNMFVSPYTLDQAICEIHHNGSTQKYYDLTKEYDVVEVAGTYERLSYKNPNNSVHIILPDGTERNVSINTLQTTSQEVGTRIYYKN